MTKRKGPLAGIKVLELTVFMSGPTCGLLLADMGASVVKVERFPDGDDARRFAPPSINGEPASFMILNRNKRGMAVDAKHPDGARVLRRLCGEADVLIENFRPGVLDKLGLGYEALKAENPGLIFATITGFGTTGPDCQRPGLDLIAQGFSGLMSITGEGPGRPPVKVGAPVSDTTAGMLLACGIMAALVERGRTGLGQRVETSLIEAALAHTYWQSAMALATGEAPQPLGSAHPLSAPYQAFACSDGYVIAGAPSDSLFARVLSALGAGHLAEEERFTSNALRIANRDALTAALEPYFAALTRAECLERLDAAGVPCGPVHTMPEALAHRQTRARGMVIEVEHPKAGRVEALGCPVKFPDNEADMSRAAPLLGGDTAEVLAELGYTPEEIAQLERDGAVMAGGVTREPEVS